MGTIFMRKKSAREGREQIDGFCPGFFRWLSLHDGKPWHGSAGFTIIGLAMLMVLLGMLASALPYLMPGNREVSDKETALLLEANRNAIIGYAGMQGRLPTAQNYPSLVRSQMDHYHHVTHYTYDAALAMPGGICRASRGQAGLEIRGLAERAAFVLWSDGQDGKTSPAKPEGAVPSESQIAVGGDDILKWASLKEMKAVARCR